LILHLCDNRRELEERAETFSSFVKTALTWDAVAGKILQIASGRCHDLNRQETDGVSW